jgi:hypothetical protein
MTFNQFADAIRDLPVGQHFVDHVPVRVAVRKFMCGGPAMHARQREYTIHGLRFYTAINAAAWATE